MLGEDHSIVIDFPELKETLTRLNQSDTTFFEDNKRYNALDKEIRELELQDSPVQDDAMHALKHDRSVLKDSLYKRLMAAKNNS